MTPRLLRHARKNHGPLQQNGAHSFAAQHALVHFSSGAVYTYIPKNGCTTLRYSLALANGAIAGPEDFVWIHQNNPAFVAQLRDLACAPYTFVILRCPFARLASAFLDKVVGRTVEIWNLRRFLGDQFEVDDLTFRAFCELLKTPGVRNSNIHWRPQVDFLVYEDYDSWFRLDAFDQAATEIEARTGVQIKDTRNMSRHGIDRFKLEEAAEFPDWPVMRLAEMQREGRSPSHAALYDEALVSQVAGFYRADIDLYRDLFGSEGLLFPEADAA